MAFARAVASRKPSEGKRMARALAVSATFTTLLLIVFLSIIPSARVLAADAPAVTSLSVTSGPTVGGVTVVITGTGFTGLSGASAVSFGGSRRHQLHGSVRHADRPRSRRPTAPAKVDVIVTAAGGASAEHGCGRLHLHDALRPDRFPADLGGHLGRVLDLSGLEGQLRPFGQQRRLGHHHVQRHAPRLDRHERHHHRASPTCTWTMCSSTTIDLSNAVAVYQQNVWSTGTVGDGTAQGEDRAQRRPAPRAST